MQILYDTISRIYHIEWISGMVLFIAGRRAIAGSAAGSNQVKHSRVQLSKLLLQTCSKSSCTKKFFSISMKIMCSVYSGKWNEQVFR